MDFSKSPGFVLTVSGSDASGSAGMQADNRAIHAMGAFPLNVVTALTLQTEMGVQSIDLVSPELVRMHVLGLLKTYPVEVLKAGMLGSAKTVRVLVEVINQYRSIKLVLDPVLHASSGRPLLDKEGVEVLNKELLSKTWLLTPNLPELAALAGFDAIDNEQTEKEAVKLIHRTGCRAVLVKGGHRPGHTSVDRLYEGGTMLEFTSGRIATLNSRGTGCALASLIAGGLATGLNLSDAIKTSKNKLTASLKEHSGQAWPGGGPGFI